MIDPVLLQDFIQIDQPFALVADLVKRDPAALLQAHALDAYREGEELSIRLNASVGGGRAHKRVALDLASPYERSDGLVVPICWWATKAAWLFPCLEGDLVFAPVGEHRTQITLLGRYDPPLAAVGRGIDHLMLHRVVDSSVRSFLTKIGDGLKDGISLGA